MEEKTNQANAIEENAAKEFEQAMNEATPEDRKKAIEELRKKYKEQIEEKKAKNKEAQAAMSEGKGRLKLETPIRAGDEEIKELIYDFNELTGIEYTDAMDSDINAQQIYRSHTGRRLRCSQRRRRNRQKRWTQGISSSESA